MISTISAWLADHLGVAYVVIVIFTGMIYRTAFDFPLPIARKIMVYVFLSLGCLLLTLFHLLRFPIIPVLMVTVMMIVVTKLRLKFTKMKQE